MYRRSMRGPASNGWASMIPVGTLHPSYHNAFSSLRGIFGSRKRAMSTGSGQEVTRGARFRHIAPWLPALFFALAFHVVWEGHGAVDPAFRNPDVAGIAYNARLFV